MELMGAGVLHRAEQDGIAVELARGDHGVDARHVHLDNAPRSNIQVADFAISHLAVGKPDERTRSMDEGIRIFAQQFVVGRLARGGNGVALDGGSETPTVEDSEDQRSRAGHYWRKAFLPGNRAESPSACSMRSNWLYLAMRSVRLADPVLIWPAPVATTRSAMNGSSVSPERCDTTAV